MTQHQLLLRLQDLDGQMARLDEQRRRNGLSAYQERLERISEELNAKMQRLGVLEAALSDDGLPALEQEIRALQASIAKSSSYDTALLKSQLTPLEQKKAELEDLTLRNMLEFEELQPQLPGLRESLAEVQQELEEARPEEQERLDNLAMRLEAMARERAELTGLLPTDVWQAYVKTGRVEEIKQGRCRCRLEVPDHFQRQIRAGNAWVCNTCGSLLVQTLKP
ncbi:MAG: hypothetical protein KF760_13545 [Candidatus Eremiobacteraeota bacterium]|nr:hypothetical protein [Candidatus Eremiobacteraeota bacterium]MCW5867808.1 hypothetical protein [Candidatus Eremiobacteraeota bacterium]